MSIVLNSDQQRAFDVIMDFIRTHKGDGRKYITLGGYAGTGKTTLISSLAAKLKQEQSRLAFCALSGKASGVLRKKINDVFNPDTDYSGTIHSFIYRFIGKCRETNRPMFEHIGNDGGFDVVFVDEASMVNKYIFEDLMNIPRAVKIFIGDHGQLPPVGDKFNLMEDPEIRLEKIVRQAEDNPIINVSFLAREGGQIPFGIYGDQNEVVKTSNALYMNKYNLNEDDIVCLSATNKERQNINSGTRAQNKFIESYPMVGEKVVCLMNDRAREIYNGQLGRLSAVNNNIEKIWSTVRRYDKEVGVYSDHECFVDCYDCDFKLFDFPEKNFSSYLLRDQFGNINTLDSSQDYNLFDWAYCLTVHKAQGSEWPTVVLLESGEHWLKQNWNRWLYTAVTRAKERLIIIKK